MSGTFCFCIPSPQYDLALYQQSHHRCRWSLQTKYTHSENMCQIIVFINALWSTFDFALDIFINALCVKDYGIY